MGRRIVLALILVGMSTFSVRTAGAGEWTNVCEREMAQASARHNVPLGMLYAVGLTETGRRDSLRPNALNIEGKTVYDISREEALRRFEEARTAGAKLIDVGCMQINHYYHAKNFASVDEMLDPRKNVDYAARFLRVLREREGSWTMAVARYNAGPNNNAAQQKYVCRVIANMVASGFGEWTEEARSFCRSDVSSSPVAAGAGRAPQN
jgi:soluble lytic murein transglycosylase-like protein